MSGVRWLIMSSKRVWAVMGQYRTGVMRPLTPGMPIEYESLEQALGDVEYLNEAGYGSSLRSYVVPA